MNNRALISVLLLLLLPAIAPSSNAGQASYRIDFSVDYFLNTPHDARVELGNIYTGTFTLDDSILSEDGINKAGSLSAFLVSMEDVTWNMQLRCPLSDFCWFRGPSGFGVTPGFDVVGGQIINLRGGVVGSADYPLIDFSTSEGIPIPPGQIQGCPPGTLYCGNSPNSYVTANPLGGFGGAMTVYTVAAPVPEPEAYAMALLGLVMVFIGFLARGGLRSPYVKLVAAKEDFDTPSYSCRG